MVSAYILSFGASVFVQSPASMTSNSSLTMGKKRKVLTQEEIWDDSALIESWDEALAEYHVSRTASASQEPVRWLTLILAIS